ncbi:MAG: hypothetical protein AAFU79_06030, partial [Myxococcota bacterium]
MPSSFLRFALPLAFFACATAGARDFELGRSLRESGDLEGAHAAFVRASDADPEDAAAAAARRETGAVLAARLAEEATAQAQSGEHRAAAQTWRKASEFAPQESRYAARADLAAGRADNLEPDAWASRATDLEAAHPGSAEVKAAASAARRDAYAYHLVLGREALARPAGSEALRHFDAARALDPTTPGLSLDEYDEAQARALAEDAEAKAAAGDA